MPRQRKPTTTPADAPRDVGPQPGQSAMVYPDQPYGEGKALVEQQQAAPVAGSAPPAAAAQAPTGASLPRTPLDVFRPTERPDEPITSGLMVGPGRTPSGVFVAPDPDVMLKAMYEAYPHPTIARLMRPVGSAPRPDIPIVNEQNLDRPSMMRDAARAARRPTAGQLPPRRPS